MNGDRVQQNIGAAGGGRVRGTLMNATNGVVAQLLRAGVTSRERDLAQGRGEVARRARLPRSKDIDIMVGLKLRVVVLECHKMADTIHALEQGNRCRKLKRRQARKLRRASRCRWLDMTGGQMMANAVVASEDAMPVVGFTPADHRVAMVNRG